ncbi:hypothetical protein I2I05_06265 [Hymenobacter sp. BT683]|uniref:Uncharacterized protein n=1 Tax=Hymenobacter jeongseonensis TaxID=2791027 RepID=A0ABS0IFA3_9BACT|nr:hypothetical protein [Hymenobacter jeongseonensis]MBF9236995.1 hypothetical protein [Hymenobacter jeongseonensis]
MRPSFRYCLYLTLLLSMGFATTHAQTLSAPAPVAAPASASLNALTRADTARAVHELFRSRRGGGVGWLALGTAGILASTLPAQQSTSAGVWTPGVVAGSAFLLIGLNKRIQFRPGRERNVLSELAATGHLPANVTRRLRGNFAPLHGTASAENPLLAKGIAPSIPLAGSPAPTSAPLQPVLTPAQLLADARQDTLDAVQGLFNAKRLGGQLPILLALPGLRLMTGASGTSTPSSPYQQPQRSEPSGGQVALGLLLMTGGVTYMFLHNAPYTDAKFDALRTSYLAGTPLPPAIRAQLKNKHVAAGRTYRERLERKAARKRKD